MTHINVYWYMIPLVVAISLVYAASRHESWSIIWRHAAQLCGKILLALAITTVILLLINTTI